MGSISKNNQCFAVSFVYLQTALKKDDMNIDTVVPKKNVMIKNINGFSIDEIGDDHLFTGLETPMKADAFVLSDEEKKSRIALLFSEIMDVMGLDLTDDSLKGTPDRVAKMFIEETFSGLNPKNKPKIALFDNKYHYNQMLVEKTLRFTPIVNIILFP